MAHLLDEQWELDGLLFGKDTGMPVLADGLDYGAHELSVQDVDRSQGDGVLLGRDRAGGVEIALTIGVVDGVDVWPQLYRLQRAWDAAAVRSKPGAVSTLRYRRAGQVYRMLGRPRKFGIAAANNRNNQFQRVEATFWLPRPEMYLEPGRSLVVRLVQPASTSGLSFPAAVPFRFGTSGASVARTGEVTVGGYGPTPFRVVVHGPNVGSLQGFSVSGDGWEVTSSAAVAYDQTAVIDTRAETVTVAGRSVVGTLSRKTRLTARLQPGHQFVKFSAGDPTGTAYADVTWMDAVPA